MVLGPIDLAAEPLQRRENRNSFSIVEVTEPHIVKRCRQNGTGLSHRFNARTLRHRAGCGGRGGEGHGVGASFTTSIDQIAPKHEQISVKYKRKFKSFF
ncbi:hypothetical protein E3O21_03255 [Cryobacterium flavum]|uniref:Uncharacterized protein n=1 Tax=Cryobacterium flavum TaxID=1424659 RepID=A0ABY2I413_9MICO|nr:hypothetical protein [Cryobacterium flavum]TFB80905.1 hypothetical protein E3O21_03255 [Cryobacterium flavum]